MDYFWIIPLFIIAVCFFWGFYRIIVKHSPGQAEEHIIVDKRAPKFPDEQTNGG
jgi:hypothetical protein